MEIDNRLYQPLIIISNNNNKTVKRKRYYSANKRDLKTSQCGHFQKPAFWDFNTHNKSNTNNVFMTNISLKEKEHNQFIMQDFSKYRKKPEQYLPKSEINKLFLEKISSSYKEPKKNNITPRSSMHSYNNSDRAAPLLYQRQVFNNRKYVNRYSNCDENYLKAKSTHINKLKRTQSEYYRLRKHQPLKIVSGMYESQKIVIPQKEETNQRSVSIQTLSTYINN